jgi:hypothetical protein
MPWQEIEDLLAHLFDRQVRAGKKIEVSELFGATEVIAGAGISYAGRPRLPTRLMVSLLYYQFTVARWASRVSVRNGGGSADSYLYVGIGQVPTTLVNACARIGYGNQASCNFDHEHS